MTPLAGEVSLSDYPLVYFNSEGATTPEGDIRIPQIKKKRLQVNRTFISSN